MTKKQGPTIKNALRVRGMSQGELARRLGVTASHISKVIGGTRGFSKRQTLAVSEILGIPLVELMK